ncbi:MAG: hypothetical protein B7Y31_03790, partial [Novosphingobium sp. 16-62-11]
MARRRRSKLPLFAVVLLVVGALGWLAGGWVSTGPLEQQIEFDVGAGAGLSVLSDDLEEQGAIRSATLFKLRASLLGGGTEVRKGSFLIPKGASEATILEILKGDKVIRRLITIPEGMPSIMVAERLMANKDLTGPVSAPGEGTVLPDSYDWQKGEPRVAVLKRMQAAMDKTLNYVLGAYFFKEAGDLHDYVTFAEGLLQVDGPNDLSTKNYAFFGQIDYRPTEQFGITIGGRYTKENKTFEGFQSDANGLTYKILNQVGVPECASINPISDACRIAAGFPNQGEPLRYYIAGTQRKSFSDFSPKIGLQYHPTDDVMLYGSWSKGYKTGGWTTRLSNPLPTAPDFDEEKATTWEVGVKSMFLDNRLQINAAAFHTDYKGIQLNFQQGVSPTIQNAGDARIKGFEVEVVAAPTDGFLINASVGYTDATYTAVLAGAQVAANPFQAGVFPGADLPKTPKWKFNVSPRYELSVGGDAKVVILGDWTHTTSLWNDTERAFLLQRGPTDIVNGNISYKSGNHWDLTVGVTNITDERYLVTGQAQIT